MNDQDDLQSIDALTDRVIERDPALGGVRTYIAMMVSFLTEPPEFSAGLRIRPDEVWFYVMPAVHEVLDEEAKDVLNEETALQWVRALGL